MVDHLTDNPFVLEARGVIKIFGQSKALDGVNFGLRRGEVHALLGENGAGKSTLIKILTGAYQPDGGEVLLDGEPVHFADPLNAQAHGIGRSIRRSTCCRTGRSPKTSFSAASRPASASCASR